jgi:hypothetical protein
LTSSAWRIFTLPWCMDSHGQVISANDYTLR